MTTTAGTMRFDQLPTDYEGLVRLHMLRPIEDDVQLENATGLIDLMAGHELNKDQADYLDVLSDLVDKHEAAHSPVADDARDVVDVVHYLLELHDMNASDLGRLLGDRSLGTRILNKERSLSKRHARILGQHFKVSPALFI